MAKITGLGGVFYRVKDPEATRAWYRDVLGIDGEYGPILPWAQEKGESPYSLISHFADESYIRPGTGGFMINLRVDDLDAFVRSLRQKGVDVLNSVDRGYGKFAWLLDPDGIKIELWQQCAAPPG
ncbi:glyoxalase [Novosphingobium malaysiense]|uniref:Glyoxalase n=2 Tax=Novosphingobium malaysiense TaxID=1348853 RepID=A0A0B1ZIY2_9SPHN|nr:VOC family protein [Novosphingobium malaysiense]KHK91060.1 glyoxalase [Novosphingobium malaysiense]